MRFFSYDPEGDGFELHETLEEAIEAAEFALNSSVDSDGFDEDVVAGICCGAIMASVIIENRRELTAQEKTRHPEWSFYGEPKLRPVENARPLEEWHEDDGPVLWWRFPVEEAPWIGTPHDPDWQIGWDGPDGAYYTHWTPLPLAPEKPEKRPDSIYTTEAPFTAESGQAAMRGCLLDAVTENEIDYVEGRESA